MAEIELKSVTLIEVSRLLLALLFSRTNIKEIDIF